jgi:hypothetical protein
MLRTITHARSAIVPYLLPEDAGVKRIALMACALLASFSAVADDGDRQDSPRFHDDYYEGFAQGVYYGLLLRGEDYAIAWCMKSELGYEAKSLGTGGDFQKNIESLLARCRENSSAAEDVQ